MFNHILMTLFGQPFLLVLLFFVIGGSLVYFTLRRFATDNGERSLFGGIRKSFDESHTNVATGNNVSTTQIRVFGVYYLGAMGVITFLVDLWLGFSLPINVKAGYVFVIGWCVLVRIGQRKAARRRL